MHQLELGGLYRLYLEERGNIRTVIQSGGYSKVDPFMVRTSDYVIHYIMITSVRFEVSVLFLLDV